MAWEPAQDDLGALGFAGICRETFMVLRRAFLPNWKGGLGAAILSPLLLVGVAADYALLSFIEEPDDGSHFVRLVAGLVARSVVAALYLMLVLLEVARICTTAYVLRVATLYCTDGDSGASDRILQDLPRAPVVRIHRMFYEDLLIAMVYILLSGYAWYLEASDKAIVLVLQLLGGAAFFGGAAYIAVLSHISCVVAALEELEGDACFVTVRKSRALLAGKFWTAAAVFVALDGCSVALQILFMELVLEDALGLGRWFQVAAGAAIAVALWAVVVVTLVAQPVVYLVCKNHHHEVVDKVNLNYIGEYQPLAVNAVEVELQPMRTEQIPETSNCPAGLVSSRQFYLVARS